MNNLNIDLVAECIKTLSNNNKCTTCDKLNEPCLRYPCGHSACEECVRTAECCLLCVTPPNKITHSTDEPLSLRVRHVSELVSPFQELFNVNVYRRSNIFEKLKVEKQVFPECIQAPNTYYNKRKSSFTYCKEKENISPKSVLPGEIVSYKSIIKMENKNDYVKRWLNNNETQLPRKPFADINLNLQNQSPIPRGSYRKRTHVKTVIPNNENNLEVPNKKSKKEAIKKDSEKSHNTNYNDKHDKNESGIVVDDEVIEINDSQSQVIDKDKLACMLVLEAEKNKRRFKSVSDDSLYREVSQLHESVGVDSLKKDTKTNYKVPFIKKSPLLEVCSLCNMGFTHKDKINTKNVTITVDSTSFLATINVSSCKNNVRVLNKQSVMVQTEDIEAESYLNGNNISNEASKIYDSNNIEYSHIVNKDIVQNNDLLVNDNNEGVTKGLVIYESDTDSSCSVNNESIEINAEVHRSCDQSDYGILSALDQNQAHGTRHARRERTPLSTDSSDKENYDPNRRKRSKPFEKKSKKKL